MQEISAKFSFSKLGSFFLLFFPTKKFATDFFSSLKCIRGMCSLYNTMCVHFFLKSANFVLCYPAKPITILLLSPMFFFRFVPHTCRAQKRLIYAKHVRPGHLIRAAKEVLRIAITSFAQASRQYINTHIHDMPICHSYTLFWGPLPPVVECRRCCTRISQVFGTFNFDAEWNVVRMCNKPLNWTITTCHIYDIYIHLYALL